ncbi:MAG: TolC family protein [Pirellula sp.]|nr:TolC family protein [Pirellula sp.]
MRSQFAIALVSCLAFPSGCSTTQRAQTQVRRPILVASNTVLASKHSDAPNVRGSNAGSVLVTAASFVVESEAYQSGESTTDSTLPSGVQPAEITTTIGERGYALEQIESIALANNPSLQAAGLLVQKAAGLRYQVGLAPNPTLGYFGQQIAAQGTDQHGVFVEQEFVRGNKLQLNRDVLSSTQNAQQWSVVAQQYRLLTDIRTGFYEALAAQQQLEIAQSLLEVAKRGVQVASDRLGAGEGSQIDVLQSQTLLSEISLTAERLDLAYRGTWQHLAAVAGLDENTPVRLEGELMGAETSPNWDNVLSELLAASPELSVANSIVAEKGALVRREQAQVIPNVTGQFGAGYDRGTDSGMINLQVAAPIPVWNKNSGNISAACAEYRRAQEDVRRLEQSIRSRLASVSREYDSALVAVKRYQNEILPQSEKGLELAESAYQAGELDFLQVLVLRRAYFESLLKSIEVKGQLAVSDARIDGLLLSQSLDSAADFTAGDGLRSASFGGQ